MRYFYYLLLPFFAIFFVGCLEIEEITQLTPNGSAELALRISLPDFPAAKKKGGPSKSEAIEENIEDAIQVRPLKGIELLDREEKNVYGLKVFTLKVRADKLARITSLYSAMKGKGKEKKKSKGKEKDKKSRDAMDQLFTKTPFKVKRKENRILITRSFVPLPPEKKKGKKAHEKEQKKDNLSQELEETFMNMVRITFEFRSPTKVLDSNAQYFDGQELRWETTLGYLVKNPLEMRIEIESTPELKNGIK